jgi:protein N-terminal methyltransferase
MDVVVLEPVESLIQKAISGASAWKGIGPLHCASSTKSVTFIQKPLQYFDPSVPLQPPDILAHVGRSTEDLPGGYDVVWCQW